MNRVRIRSSTIVILASALLSCLLLIAFRATIAADQQSAKPVKGPFIQDVHQDRATIAWVTQTSIRRSQEENAGKSAAVEAPLFNRMDVAGLEPGTRYSFELSAGGVDARVSFKTAPKEGDPFLFIVYGDTRSRHDVHKKVSESILAERPDFVLHTGDLVANGLNPEDWDKFFEIEKGLLRNIPFFPTLGNHERNSPAYFKYFAFPNGSGHYYAFDWGRAHFAVINTCEVGQNADEKELFLQKQVDWLRDDLRRHKKPLTFVMFHHPLYTVIERRKESAAKLAQKIEPVLVEGDVTAVFSGHDHNYQHHVHQGIHYIVAGGGGAPLYDVSSTSETAVKAVKIENYVRVRVEGDRAGVEAMDPDGSLLESFELKGGSRSAPEKPGP